MNELKTRIAATICGLSLAGAGLLSAGAHSGALAAGPSHTMTAVSHLAQDTTPNGTCTADQADDSDANSEDDENSQAASQADDEDHGQEENNDAGSDSADQEEQETGVSDSETEATAVAGQLSEGQDLLPQAGISVEQAVAAATGAAQGSLGDVELKDDNGMLVFEVQVDDQDVTIDAATGAIVSVQSGDSDAEDPECDDADQAAPGTLDDGADLLPQAGITLDQAVTTAQGAASGTLGEVDLETNDSGVLVFSVRIGNQEVSVDAQTGQVLEVVDAEA